MHLKILSDFHRIKEKFSQGLDKALFIVKNIDVEQWKDILRWAMEVEEAVVEISMLHNKFFRETSDKKLEEIFKLIKNFSFQVMLFNNTFPGEREVRSIFGAGIIEFHEMVQENNKRYHLRIRIPERYISELDRKCTLELHKTYKEIIYSDQPYRSSGR